MEVHSGRTDFCEGLNRWAHSFASCRHEFISRLMEGGRFWKTTSLRWFQSRQQHRRKKVELRNVGRGPESSRLWRSDSELISGMIWIIFQKAAAMGHLKKIWYVSSRLALHSSHVGVGRIVFLCRLTLVGNLFLDISQAKNFTLGGGCTSPNCRPRRPGFKCCHFRPVELRGGDETILCLEIAHYFIRLSGEGDILQQVLKLHHLLLGSRSDSGDKETSEIFMKDWAEQTV